MSTRPNAPDGEPLEPWLHDALDSVDAPSARPAFRDELRARFLAGAAASSEGLDELEPLEVATDGAERARGEAGASVGTPRPALQRTRSTPSRSSRRERVVEPKPRRRSLGPWIAVVALAAAAAVAFVLLTPDAKPRVQLVDSQVASLALDGAPLADADQLAKRLAAGATLRTEAETVRLRLDDVVLIELAAGTELSFATWSEASDGETVFDLRSGGLRVLTGPGFAPRRLTVRAPDAEVAIVGTEFGVDVVQGAGTCVCCTHGVIAVKPSGRDAADRVLEGGMSFCFASGDAPMLGDVKEDHASDVTNLRRYW